MLDAKRTAANAILIVTYEIGYAYLEPCLIRITIALLVHHGTNQLTGIAFCALIGNYLHGYLLVTSQASSGLPESHFFIKAKLHLGKVAGALVRW